MVLNQFKLSTVYTYLPKQILKLKIMITH